MIVPQNVVEPVLSPSIGFITPIPTSNSVPANKVIALDHRISLAYLLKAKDNARTIIKRPITKNIICSINISIT
jgi:hypothetical protein